MATNPNGGHVNQGMTDYAAAIFQDYAPLMADADFLAPRVVTGASHGNFAKFDDKNAFMAYSANRAIGGSRTRIKFAGENKTYSCDPKALEVGLDDHEVEDVAGSRTLIEQAKTRTLLSVFTMSAFKRVFAIAVTSGNYTASASGAGDWSNANIDPITKLDNEINRFYVRTGMLPNRFAIDFASWVTLRNHPLVTKRQPGSPNIGVTLPQMTAMLAAPVECRILSGSYETAGFGANTSSKSAIASGKVLLLYANSSATVYDPSALKVFTPSAESYESVKMYREDASNSDIFYIETSEAIESISALMSTLITVT